MVASVVAPFFEALLVATCVALLALAIGGAVVWRVARRRWRAVRAGAAAVGLAGLWDAVSRRAPSPGSVDDSVVRSWSPRRSRRELHGAVRTAGEAVQLAERSGAPTADLSSLTGRLRSVAARLDEALAMERPEATSPARSRQVCDVLTAAGAIRRAALDAVATAHDGAVGELLEDARTEVELLSSAIRSSERALPRRR